MAKGSIAGTTKRHTMVSGAMASKTAMEFGPDARETLMSDSGTRTKRMDTESTSGQTETNTRENGTNASDMAKAPTNLQMATASPGSTLTAKWTATASIVGLTATSTAAFFETIWCQAKVPGKNKSRTLTQTCTRESMQTIKNTDMANSDGRLEAFIVVTTPTIWSKATERCSGLTEAFIEALGTEVSRTGSA